MPIKMLMMKKTKKIKISKQFLVYISFVGFLFVCACTRQTTENINVATPANENQQSVFESDFQTLKTANLKFIFVIRRTDGKQFDGEDKKYLRTNLPPWINRIVLSDEEKAFIVGTNYPFPPENLEVLRLRFNVEDFSTR